MKKLKKKNYPFETISDVVSKRVFDVDWAIEDNPLTVRFYVYEIDDKDFVNYRQSEDSASFSAEYL